MHHSLSFAIGVFTFFLIGSGLNVYRHAASIINSKLSGISNYHQYFQVNGATQAFKTFGALCFLMWWSFNQSAVEALVAIVWPSFLGNVPTWLQGVLVVTPATAGMFGLSWDVLADLIIVYLKKKFPQLNSDVPPTYQSAITKELASPSVK